MRPKILAYGNDPILLTTRRLVLEKARYRVFTSPEFSDAMLVLLNQQINVDEPRGILETARAITQDVKCVILHYDAGAVPIEDAELVEGLEGPNTLLRAIGKLLTHKAELHTVALEPDHVN
jgi:hypothetical protein